MNETNLYALMASVMGNLHATTSDDEQRLSKLQELMGATFFNDDILANTTNQEFSFQSSDLFFSQNVKGTTLTKIDETVTRILSKDNAGDFRVFVRDTPIRTTQVAGSTPAWATGARLINSIGPFLSTEGRRIWFDFFKIEKMIALYIQGQSQPVLLFKAVFSRQIIIGPQQPVEITKSYTLMPGSVWIQAKLLNGAAPADRYCGIRIKAGTITLDALPQLVGTHLQIAGTNNIHCKLEMEQPVLAPVNAAGNYGADARAASISLPLNFNFTANANTHNIELVEAIEWKMYGQEGVSSWQGNQNLFYNNELSRLLIPLTTEPATMEIKECLSPFQTISGVADIAATWWGIPAAQLDINNPLEADGNGALVLLTGHGLSSTHQQQTGDDTTLVAPFFLLEPGRIGITDVFSNGQGATQDFNMWKDDLNVHGTSVHISYLKQVAAIYNTVANGDEIFFTLVNADINTDRPVKVNGEPVEVRSKNSVFVLACNDTKNFIGLYDDNIIWDHKLPAEKTPVVKPIALALENALFTVSPVNGCLLFGECSADWKKITNNKLLLTFGMFSYLPTLPDPYAANLGLLRRQLSNRAMDATGAITQQRTMWLWLVCMVDSKSLNEEKDEVKVSFHFGNMPGDTSVQTISAVQPNTPVTAVTQSTDTQRISAANKMLNPEAIRQMKLEAFRKGEMVEDFQTQQLMMNAVAGHTPNYENVWQDTIGNFENDAFALLDVSSNANQMGVSFFYFPQGRMGMIRTAAVENPNALTGNTGAISNFPFIVKDMSVWTPGYFVRAFTVPQIAWEPVFNLTPPVQPMDPDAFFNYYPNDGGPTRIFNFDQDPVVIAPKPVVKNLIDKFQNPQTQTYSIFTLPFGLKAIAQITKGGVESNKPDLQYNNPSFKNNLIGGIQIKATAGNFGKTGPELSKWDSPMFPGYTLQLNNILRMDGTANGTSTLGDSVSTIFNRNFWEDPLAFNKQKGVPVTRIDWSGYGTNMFSNWLSPSAVIAQTSQAQFNVMMGRTGHEVIQVRSVLLPWGIHVVRTITLFRTSSNYVYRVDSGWQAESDGIFDFRYAYQVPTGQPKPNDLQEVKVDKPYIIHPGVLRGLFNIKNIKEDASVADFKAYTTINNGDKIIVDGVQITYGGASFQQEALCRPVWFDADVEIENTVQGQHDSFNRDGIKTGRVACRKILGYVQLSPSGVLITQQQLNDLLASQGGAIGGTINCQVALHNSNQQMRINAFDMNASVDKNGNPVLSGAIRGNVLLPKDGSWSMVQHSVGTGEVTPLPESVTVPVIREGEWVPEKVVDTATALSKLVRIASPMELLRAVAANTVNFGFLQSTGSQKALFLTPAFANNVNQLMSKTPPLFADAYRLMTGKGIFPNIGDAVTNFGKIVPMLKGVDNVGNAVDAFVKNALQDGGTQVWELLEIKAEKQAEAAVKQGMELLQKGANGLLDKAMKFDVPDFEIPLVDIDVLKIYIDYKTGKNDDPPGNYVNSKLNFDIDSFAGDMAKNWKSRLNNLAMVVDLGGMKRLMAIKGNFDAKKGKETGYEGQADGATEGLPQPEIEFHKDLQPVIDLLEMLGQLSEGNYKEVMKKGLKIAMSNAGEIWEYKFEATKELPLVRFPPTKALYDAPTTPLKLEASLGLGVNFNAALKVTSDLNQLLPTAGAFIQFHGGLTVMCVSLAAATIYAKGSVDLRIGANTQVGPTLDMKFGFGAEIVVGLPVVANVSVLYMISVEMHIDSAVIRVTAGMLFRGHADILGGLVGVTITIEAKGTIEKIANGPTNCIAQVTFAIDISIFLVIDINFSKSWSEQRQVA